MAGVISHTPTAQLLEVRDLNAVPVVLFTGSGRNGVRRLQLVDGARNGIDLSGKTIKLVVKTGPSAANTELSAAFPLTGAAVTATQGIYDFDFSTVDFTTVQGIVCVVIYDATAGATIILAQMKCSIVKAGA